MVRPTLGSRTTKEQNIHLWHIGYPWWPCSQLAINCYQKGAFKDNVHTHPNLCPGLPGWALTRKVKPIWILLKQEIVSGSGINWAICKIALRSRQIAMPAPHHSVFLQAGWPSCRPTNSVKALKARIMYLKANKKQRLTTYQFLDDVDKNVDIPATGGLQATTAGGLCTILRVSPSATTTHQQTLHNQVTWCDAK